jgi:plasmid stability protein
MAVVSLSNFPDELYDRLLRRAADNRRKLEDEIVEAARRMLDEPRPPLSVSEKLQLADSVRAQTPQAWTTDEAIRRARDEGRA